MSSMDAPVFECEVALLSRGWETWRFQGLDFWDVCTSRLCCQTLSSAHEDPALCAPLSQACPDQCPSAQVLHAHPWPQSGIQSLY